jgi:hypothetical protein
MYLDHVICEESQRSIAKRFGCAPSVVCRAVRRIEDARDDPDFDAYVESQS